jgi:two-component system NtrC family sensor kinase
MKSSEPEASRIRTERGIGRQLAWSFGSVAVVAVGMTVMLVFLVAQISGFVHEMRQDETTLRDSRELATALREQYIQVAHGIIERHSSHVGHYGGWRQRVALEAAAIAKYVPPRESGRLETIVELSRKMDELLEHEVLPAAEKHDAGSVRRWHRRLEDLARPAFSNADAIERAMESRMAERHRETTYASGLGMLLGGTCILLVVAGSVLHTIRLRRAVLVPLRALTQAAGRVAEGDFVSRVGAVGHGEFQSVGQAFDLMVDELAARERRVVEAERMAAIGELAAGVAHELNNPIGIMRGYLKTMNPADSPEVLAEELRILDEEAHHCQRIADDLRTYSRLPELCLEDVAFPEFLEETRWRIGENPLLADADIQLDAERGRIQADPTRLRQVIMNLVQNAVHAGGPDQPVRISGRRARGGYEISVEDSGAGVPEAERSRVFEPFFTRKPGGTGLGLAVCRGIVQTHGGSISVTDGSGGGAVFTVWLPESAGSPASPGGET